MNMSNPIDSGRPPPASIRGRNGAETRSHNPYESTAQGGNTLA